MSFFFSELTIKKDAPELCLCAAFDKAEVAVVTAWAHGDFSPELPSGMSDAHLDFLASHCADIIFPGIDHTVAFRMVQLAIAYSKFLKSHRYAQEDPEITETLICCLQELLSGGSTTLVEFKQKIEAIEGWSYGARKQRIFRAVRRVYAALDTHLGVLFVPIRKAICAPHQPLTEEKVLQAERIVRFIEKSLCLSAQRQKDSREDPEDFYGTNSELAVLRLLYINPAVIHDTSRGGYMGAPLYGVPASEIEVLLKIGLLDDRGLGCADFLNDISKQQINRT